MTGNPKELDVIFDKMGYTKNTDFRKDAIRLITDWHNKQTLELPDRLESKAFYDPSGTSPLINPREIQAERIKVKEEHDGKKGGEGSPSRAG